MIKEIKSLPGRNLLDAMSTYAVKRLKSPIPSPEVAIAHNTSCRMETSLNKKSCRQWITTGDTYCKCSHMIEKIKSPTPQLV